MLTDADRAPFAAYWGNVAAMFRARCAVLAGARQIAELPVPEHRRGPAGAARLRNFAKIPASYEDIRAVLELL